MSDVKQDFSEKKCENQQVQVIVTASDTRKVAISIMYFQAKKIYCQRLSFHSKKKQENEQVTVKRRRFSIV